MSWQPEHDQRWWAFLGGMAVVCALVAAARFGAI